jgi:outer membrane protein assembly factor BamB
MNQPAPKRLRIWPAGVLLLFSFIALAVAWMLPSTHQARNIRTIIIILWTGIALLIWFLFASRAPLKLRITLLATVILIGLSAWQFLEIRGVTGDLLPIIGLRNHAPRTFTNSVNPAIHAELAQSSGEFPQFQGPHRTAVIDNVQLKTNWAENPPTLLWKIPVGAGWSGFAISGGRAITQEQRGENESVVCYNLLSGEELWAHSDAAHYNTTIAGEGPRATPTIHSNRVYTLGSTGKLNCLDIRTGKPIWQKDILQENGAGVPEWGISGSPLVFHGLVIVYSGAKSGRSLLAYSAGDGKQIWASGDSGIDYSSPMLASFAGQDQILIFTPPGIAAHNPTNGALLWEYPWRGGHPHISLPIVVGTNRLLASSGYGTGAELLEVSQDANSKWNVNRVWKSMALKSKFGPILQRGDFVFGLDDGIFTCVDLKTGQRKWKDGRYGHGQALLVGSQILVLSEKGDLILVQPSGENLQELARFHVFDDKTWNPPALAGEYLLIRNDKEAACLKLAIPSRNEKNIALLFANHIFDH